MSEAEAEHGAVTHVLLSKLSKNKYILSLEGYIYMINGNYLLKRYVMLYYIIICRTKIPPLYYAIVRLIVFIRLIFIAFLRDVVVISASVFPHTSAFSPQL